jgi:hypothetical protein
MESKHFFKAALLTAFLVIVFIIGWEWRLRSQGMPVSYDEGPPLWSDKRAMVYLPSDEATVFIGASRIKFDLDIPTWEKLTGQKAIQLAIEGECPLPILDDLAADEKFKGKLVVDVTEGLFFTSDPNNLRTPKKHIAFFKKQTPSEKASFQLNHLLESKFVFLDKNYFSLNAFMSQLPVTNRKGVFAMPHDFPIEFSRKNFDRQSWMDDRFVQDTGLRKQVTDLWLFFDSINEEQPPTGAKLDSLLQAITSDVQKIRSRGGEVLFVRTPSSGHYWPEEQKSFPREKYWDKLLRVTNSPGVHFKDYPAIDHFICPEWSHLSRPQALIFTENFVSILEKDKGWKFPHKN